MTTGIRQYDVGAVVNRAGDLTTTWMVTARRPLLPAADPTGRRHSYLLADVDTGREVTALDRELTPAPQGTADRVTFDAILELTTALNLPQVVGSARVGDVTISVIDSVMPGETVDDLPVRGFPWLALTGDFSCVPCRHDGGTRIPAGPVGGELIAASDVSPNAALRTAEALLRRRLYDAGGAL